MTSNANESYLTVEPVITHTLLWTSRSMGYHRLCVFRDLLKSVRNGLRLLLFIHSIFVYLPVLLPPFFSFYPFILLCIYFLCWLRSTLSRFHYVDWEYVLLYLSFITTYLYYLRSYISYERSVSLVSIQSFPLRQLRLYFLRKDCPKKTLKLQIPPIYASSTVALLPILFLSYVWYSMNRIWSCVPLSESSFYLCIYFDIYLRTIVYSQSELLLSYLSETI